MKLRILEGDFLLEDIAAVKKYYPNIDDDMFMTLISLDPTYRDGSNSVGKYGKWILNLYKKGTISEEDFSEITPLLTQFTTYKNRVANKDLNSYKTLDALSSTLAQVVDDDSMLSDRQKLRFRKNVKAGRVSTSAEDDYDIVFENNKYIVYVPNTHEASMKLGKGTDWCTAHENPDYFIGYTKNNGKLYIVKNKFTNEMWQFSDAFGDFLDEHDDDFDVMELLNSDKDLKKFLMRLIGFVDDGVVLYQGATIPDELKDDIITLRISDKVKYIKDYSFCNCKQLERVEIPGNVINIGENAFNGCIRLSSIVIDDGVERICRGAFRNCALSHIELPNSISDIDYWAFHGCTKLKSITIPENVRTLKEESFGNCTYLETVNIMDGVYDIQSKAFHNCKNLTSVKIPMSVVDISSYAFIGADDDKLTIYTDNDIIKPDIEKYTLFSIKPSSMFRITEESLRIRISEDTACVASKTSYNDTGLDDNGIYYFGKKPKKPVNWKDIKKDDVRKYRMNEMIKNGIFIPRCPKKPLSRKSTVSMPYISLRNPESGVKTDVTILGSKNEAKQFIVDLLYNKQFPMAASATTIQTYNENPEYYEDDMEEFYYNMSWLDDNEGEALFAESDGKAYVFDGMYADAIEAIKLRNITELIYSDAYEYIVYNAYIVYDDSIDGWRDSVDATDYLDGSFDDYRWKNIKGTYIQIPDWADDWKDVIV